MPLRGSCDSSLEPTHATAAVAATAFLANNCVDQSAALTIQTIVFSWPVYLINTHAKMRNGWLVLCWNIQRAWHVGICHTPDSADGTSSEADIGGLGWLFKGWYQRNHKFTFPWHMILFLETTRLVVSDWHSTVLCGGILGFL